MCRLLCIRSRKNFTIKPHLEKFSLIAKNSKEYQGHGWGCSYWSNGQWRIYKNIRPIWEDDISGFGSTRFLLAHARSAFKDQGIDIKNNMPFIHDQTVFIFNGELRGVKIKEIGRIGAEKIFNFILRFNNSNIKKAMEKALPIIEKRTQYIKAMNIIMANQNTICITSQFNEDSEYFTMHSKINSNLLILCSEHYPGEDNWQKIETKQVKVY